MLAGAMGGPQNVWMVTVSGDGVSDVSGALEQAMQGFEAEHPDVSPVGASVFRNAADGNYAVVLMLEMPTNG